MEPVEVTLETALVDGQTKVDFEYEGKSYTGTLKEAWVNPEKELTVESVNAINGQVIPASTATELKFLVNGTEELTATEFEEKYEGYKVAFKYNKTGLDAKGNVNVAAGTYKYAVEVTGIKVLKPGTVTFTVKFEGIKETSTITVNVKAAQAVVGIKADATTARVTTGADVNFTLLDKDEEAMRAVTNVFYTATLADGTEADTATSVSSDANGVAKITAEAKAGVYTVNVYKEAEKENKLGSFTYEVVAVAGNVTKVPGSTRFLSKLVIR